MYHPRSALHVIQRSLQKQGERVLCASLTPERRQHRVPRSRRSGRPGCPDTSLPPRARAGAVLRTPASGPWPRPPEELQMPRAATGHASGSSDSCHQNSPLLRPQSPVWAHPAPACTPTPALRPLINPQAPPSVAPKPLPNPDPSPKLLYNMPFGEVIKPQHQTEQRQCRKGKLKAPDEWVKSSNVLKTLLISTE